MVMKKMILNFLKCGTFGWCLEILFTSFDSFRKRELKLIGNTSVWMFPIYGLASLIQPLSLIIKDKSIWIRGSFYMICIFFTEYLTGSFLKRHKLCPWDYSKSRFHYKGLIRLDYAPFWFLTGLFYEKILSRKPTSL